MSDTDPPGEIARREWERIVRLATSIEALGAETPDDPAARAAAQDANLGEFHRLLERSGVAGLNTMIELCDRLDAELTALAESTAPGASADALRRAAEALADAGERQLATGLDSLRRTRVGRETGAEE